MGSPLRSGQRCQYIRFIRKFVIFDVFCSKNSARCVLLGEKVEKHRMRRISESHEFPQFQRSPLSPQELHVTVGFARISLRNLGRIPFRDYPISAGAQRKISRNHLKFDKLDCSRYFLHVPDIGDTTSYSYPEIGAPFQVHVHGPVPARAGDRTK